METWTPSKGDSGASPASPWRALSREWATGAPMTETATSKTRKPARARAAFLPDDQEEQSKATRAGKTISLGSPLASSFVAPDLSGPDGTWAPNSVEERDQWGDNGPLDPGAMAYGHENQWTLDPGDRPGEDDNAFRDLGIPPDFQGDDPKSCSLCSFGERAALHHKAEKAEGPGSPASSAVDSSTPAVKFAGLLLRADDSGRWLGLQRAINDLSDGLECRRRQVGDPGRAHRGGRDGCRRRPAREGGGCDEEVTQTSTVKTLLLSGEREGQLPQQPLALAPAHQRPAPRR